jgi:hypothetical protein
LDKIVQLLKPSLKRIAPLTVNVLANLNHAPNGITKDTI